MKPRLLLLAAVLLLSGCAGSSNPASSPAVQPGETAALPGETASAEGTLEAVFFNVGRADALLLRAGGSTLLIDTGTEEAAPRLLGDLRALGVTSLDAVVLTHSHKDHIGGLDILAENLPLGQVYCAALGDTDKNGILLCQKKAEAAGLAVTLLQAGDTLPFAGRLLEVLGPLEHNTLDDNDNSLVLALTWGSLRWLFTGDMQYTEEKTLLDAGTNLAADVLKVGNHGNADATSPSFAAAVSPRWAIIPTNTAADANSANPRVKALLSPAALYITQDTQCGWRLTQAEGTISADDPLITTAEALPVELSLDAGTQTLTLAATGDADLSGWMIRSQNKGSLFVFPEGTLLTAGETRTLTGAGGGGDFLWGQKKPFKAGGDKALLLTPWGRLP